MLRGLARRALPVLALVVVLGVGPASLSAQEREPYVPVDRPAMDEQAAPPGEDPDNAFELAIGGDALWAAYRSQFHRGEGYWNVGFLVNEDDDVALQARIMRFAEPAADAPLGLGLGLGVFGARVDESSDGVAALTLTGAADYALDEVLDLAYPMRVGAEVSYAPDLATFIDGERVFDVRALVEVDLSTWATGFVGYRHLEVDLENEDDAELDSSFQVGVRLGF